MDISTLKQRQGLTLDEKIILSQSRIRDWIHHYEGYVYVSFSGGKDSTVLLHLVREVHPNIPAVFVDTGLEFPEIRDFVKTIDNVVWLRPKMSFLQVIEKYGYPIISKEQAQYISEYRTTKSEKLRNIRWLGNEKGGGKISEKWKFLVNAPFKISDKCCNILKKDPIKKYERMTGEKPFIGNMAEESSKRKQDYLRYGCNSFGTKRPISRPLGFWKEQDIWGYIKKFGISYSKIYDMGYDRTGCVFCGFGCSQFDKFGLLQKSHPNLHEYCMNVLGIQKVLDYIKENQSCVKLIS